LGLVGGSRIGNQWTQTEVVAPAKERRFGGGWCWVVWYLDRISKLLANFNGAHTEFTKFENPDAAASQNL